ncbi:MAG: ABC transporter permease subunit [Candidatus Promineifilaceae bacterium]
MNEQLRFLFDNLLDLVIGFPGHRPGGLLMSLFLAVFAIGIGFLIALLVGTGRYFAQPSHEPNLFWRMVGHLCQVYIELVRGLPLLLLLVLIHTFGNRDPRTSALMALTLYSSAYQAEIVRAGLQAVPQTLVDSARTLGSTRWQTLVLVRWRYGLRLMLPAFTGEAISLFKDTSVVLILGVSELMTVSRVVLSSSGSTEPYWIGVSLLVGLLYFVVAFSLSQLAQRWEQGSISADGIQSLAYER